MKIDGSKADNSYSSIRNTRTSGKSVFQYVKYFYFENSTHGK